MLTCIYLNDENRFPNQGCCYRVHLAYLLTGVIYPPSWPCGVRIWLTSSLLFTGNTLGTEVLPWRVMNTPNITRCMLWVYIYDCDINIFYAQTSRYILLTLGIIDILYSYYWYFWPTITRWMLWVYGCDITIFYVGMSRFLLSLGTIDILYLVNSNFCANKIISETRKRSLACFRYYFIHSEIII